MKRRSSTRSLMGIAAAAAGFAAGAYAVFVTVRWLRYGQVAPGINGEQDALLDQFMPTYDVVERHQIRVAAPAHITLAAAREQDLQGVPLIRAIFRARELILRARPDTHPPPRGLLAQTQALGWGILADVPGQEIVVGAVTKPWEPNVRFHALPPGEFAAFADPGFVKIVWTLRADSLGADASLFRTETRAVATDAAARARFRRYWAFMSAGIALIRRLSLPPLKRNAERRIRTVHAHTGHERPGDAGAGSDTLEP
jgi:hypothetical protein